MIRPKNIQSAEYNGQIDNILEAYKLGNCKSYRAAVRAFDMSKTAVMKYAKGQTTHNLAYNEEKLNLLNRLYILHSVVIL